MKKKTTTKKKTTPKNAAPKKPASATAQTNKPTVKTAAPARKESKKDLVLRLLQRETGATLTELMTATGWQAHSVRGFISGSLRKKLGLTIERLKDANEPTYRAVE